MKNENHFPKKTIDNAIGLMWGMLMELTRFYFGYYNISETQPPKSAFLPQKKA